MSPGGNGQTPDGPDAEPMVDVRLGRIIIRDGGEQQWIYLTERGGERGFTIVIGTSDAGLATTDAEAARAAGRELGADWVVFGSFTRFGDGASLDVRCAEVAAPAEEGARSIFVQAGRVGDIIPQLDGLAEKVARFVDSGGQARPDVAAAGPAAAPGAEVESLREELRGLRDRVEKLEAILPGGSSGTSSEPVTERDLGGGGGAPGADLAGELR